MVTYRIYFCLGGRKDRHEAVYEFEDRLEWLWNVGALPYDIIDDDDYNVWFDFGDE